MQKQTPQMTYHIVNTPELEKEYQRIVVEVFSEFGRSREDVLAEPEGAQIEKTLIKYDGKFYWGRENPKEGNCVHDAACCDTQAVQISRASLGAV